MLIVSVCLGLSARAAAAPWSTTTPLPEAFQGHALVYSANRLFHIGGISYNGGILDGVKVFSAAASDAGTVGAWSPGAALPEAVYYHAAAAVNGHLYVLGGFHYTDADGMVVSNVVYRSKIGPDGLAGAWQTASALPEPVFFPSAAVWNGRIYVTGGWNGSALVNRVYSAETLEDGSLGPWVAQKSLPEAVYTHAAVSDGTLYVLGGTVNGGNDIQNTVYFAKINADGTLADWAATTPLPSPLSNHGAVVANGRVLVLGGWTGTAPSDAVQSSSVDGSNGLGAWSAETPLPRPLYLLATAASPSHVFVSGGIDYENIRNEVHSMPLPAAPAPPAPADALPPRTTIAFGSPFYGGAPYISPKTPAALAAVDDARAVGDGAGVGVAATHWAVDDGAFSSYAAPIQVPADGSHWIRYRSVDALGHSEDVRASSAVVDGTPPVSALSIGSPRAALATGETIVGPATFLAVSAEDPVVNGAASGVAATLAAVGGAALAVSSSAFALPASDGPHEVVTKALDNVGNEETARSATVYRDGTPPATALSLSAAPYDAGDGGAPIVGAGTALAFTADDPASGGIAAGVHHTEYALDAGEPAAYTGPFGMLEGARSVSYRSVDSVANAEAWRTASYRVDLTAPQSALSWEGAPAPPTTDSAFTLTARDPVSNGVASGVKRILYSVDGAPDAAYAGAFRLAAGSHTVTWLAEDNAGNAGDREGAAVAVGSADRLPPRTALAFGAPTHGPTPFISPLTPAVLTAVDDARAVGDAAGAGVASTQWALDGGAFAEYAGPIHIAADGAHWIRYRSVDALGRAEEVRASSAAVDGSAPVSSLSIGSPRVQLASGEVIVGPATALAVSAVDPAVNGAASGVAWTRGGIDGAALAASAGPFTLPAADGAHSISMQAGDNVGNAEAVHAATVYRDGAPPATTLAFSSAPYAGASGPVYGTGALLSFAAADPLDAGGAAAGVQRTEYALDGGAPAAYTGAFGAAEGAHTLAYRSYDNVGNAEPELFASFTVDATAPRTVLTVDGGARLFGADVLTSDSAVALSASDPVSNGATSGVRRVVYSLDGGPDQPYAGPFRLSPGAHTVVYGAVDNAGNEEPRSSAALSVGTFLADALAGLDSVTLSGGAGVTGSVRSNGAFTANGRSTVAGNVAALTVSLGGQSTISGSVTKGAGALSASSYDLAAAAAWARERNDNASIPAGCVDGTTLKLNSGDACVLPAGDYYLTGISLSGQSRLSVSGRVNVFLHGPLSVSGGAELNASGEANDLWLVADMGGASLSGNSRAAFNLYAPASQVSISGGGQFAGRVLGRTASLSGKALQPSMSSLPAVRHEGRPASPARPQAAREGPGTAGAGHAAGRASEVASARLDSSAPSVAPRGSSSPAAAAPAGPEPALASVSEPAAPRPPKRFAPAPPLPGPGTAGRGRSASGPASVASSRLERLAPVRAASGPVVPPPAALAAAAPADAPAREKRVKSSMPALALSARAAFAAVGRDAHTVRAKDRSAVVIPEGAATAAVGVTVSPPKKSDVVENRRQAAVESRKGLVAASLGVQYGPEGTHFAKPVTLELPYDRASLPAGVLEKDLFVHYWNPVNGDWEKLESSVDSRNQIVRAQTTHFSLYQVFAGGSAASAPSSPNDPTFAVHAAYAFPNPSRNGAPVVVRVQPGLADSVSVRVYDLSGRLVHESSNFQNRGGFDDGNGFGSQFTFDHAWDVSGVGSGVYNFVVTGHKAGAGKISASGKVGVIK